MIAVAPNGARKTKQDHPAIPLSARELAMTAAECQEAGACMIHLHVRDQHGRHSLDADRYREAISEIRKQVGNQLIIQVTTEAVGIYNPEQQIAMVKELRPEAISVAIREICPGSQDEKKVADFFHWMQLERISPQYILYDTGDIKRFRQMQQSGIVPQQSANILLVLGRYTDGQQSRPEQLKPMQSLLDQCNLWWLCAFGSTELQCMEEAMMLGGHCRVGFENNLSMPDGSQSDSNRDLVSELARQANRCGKEVYSPTQARELMEIWQEYGS
jgi:3-keto-5-aminohexanoate cleavage enzyme